MHFAYLSEQLWDSSPSYCTGKEPPFWIQRDSSLVDPSLCPHIVDRENKAFSAEAWVEKIMQEAECKGMDSVGVIWDAVRRTKAAERGEVFDRAAFAPYCFDSRWR